MTTREKYLITVYEQQNLNTLVSRYINNSRYCIIIFVRKLFINLQLKKWYTVYLQPRLPGKCIPILYSVPLYKSHLREKLYKTRTENITDPFGDCFRFDVFGIRFWMFRANTFSAVFSTRLSAKGKRHYKFS